MNRSSLSTLARASALVVIASMTIGIGACAKKPATPYPPAPPPSAAVLGTGGAGGATIGSERPPDAPALPGGSSVSSSALAPDTRSTEELNGPTSPLKPVMFGYDSDAIDDAGRKVLAANVDVLKANRVWVVTVEGHCDERGTAEYNLSLGDRRALAVKNYLVSLGIPADRLRTVSYGKEFPFDHGHNEAAWAQNRRAHFMITSNDRPPVR